MEKKNIVIILTNSDIHGEYAGNASLQGREFVVMRGKQSAQAATRAPGQFFHYCPGQGHTVVCAGSTPDFIQNDQAAPGGLAQNARGFHHFHHEGALALSQIVRSAHAGEKAIHQTQRGLGRRHHGTHLSQQADNGNLAQYRGFAGHIGASEQAEPALLIQPEIVGHKIGAAQHGFHHRMAAFANLQMRVIGKAGTAPIVLAAHLSEALPVIKLGYQIRHMHNTFPLPGHVVAQFLKHLVFQALAFVSSGEQLFFQLLERHSGEAFSVGQSLPANKVLRHGTGMGCARHFIIITKHAVIAHLQLCNAGSFLLFFK